MADVRLEHLDPSTDHVPVAVFNALVDVVNSLADSMRNLIAVIAAEMGDDDDA